MKYLFIWANIIIIIISIIINKVILLRRGGKQNKNEKTRTWKIAWNCLNFQLIFHF